MICAIPYVVVGAFQMKPARRTSVDPLRFCSLQLLCVCPWSCQCRECCTAHACMQTAGEMLNGRATTLFNGPTAFFSSSTTNCLLVYCTTAWVSCVRSYFGLLILSRVWVCVLHIDVRRVPNQSSERSFGNETRQHNRHTHTSEAVFSVTRQYFSDAVCLGSDRTDVLVERRIFCSNAHS